jgi:hypothetical protein
MEDRTDDRRFDPKEFQADCFAGALLMPQIAVKRAFALRGWNPTICTPESFYVVATWLGVGYTTLIHHMERALGMLNKCRAEGLLRCRPKEIRSRLVGRECREHLVVVDDHWRDCAIDIQVPDLMLLPPHVRLEGKRVEVIEQGEARTIACAVRPGIGRVASERSDWSAYVRVSRRQFVGRAKYRFEEEVDDAG